MTLSEAEEILHNYLKINNKATNSTLTGLLDGDSELFQKVREELIFNDIAEDKKGVGLIYIEEVEEEEEEETQAPAPMNERRVFISYGRKDAEKPAKRLASDLEKLGHKVWLDKEQIKTGKSWEEQIESAILSSDIFVSLLSPHAVRRPDGVCLDEISMARYNSRKIIPLMVINCRPPLGIYRLDWLDFQDWENPQNYQTTLDKIGNLFHSEEANVEGSFADIFAMLKPIDFKLDIYKHIKNFVGRNWLLKDIETWLGNNDSRLMFITGDPGTGKTALMAKLIHVFPSVAAYHFCISKYEVSLVPERFIQSLAAQLATQIEEYREAISHLNLEAISSYDASSAFKLLLIDPLSKIHPEQKHIIIIDALDEALYYGSNNIVKLLHEWLDELPDWLKLVITSRKVKSILSLFDFYKPFEIEVNKSENIQDIRHYALSMLEQHFSEKYTEIQLSSIADEISKRSEGIFLYVKTTVQSIIAGNIDAEQIDSLPPGLGGMYLTNFDRLFPDRDSFEEIRQILQIILASFEPLNIKAQSAFLNIPERSIKQQLRKINEFFPEKDNSYSSFHKSIEDWLTGYGYHDHPYLCDLVEGHTHILNSLDIQWENKEISEYLLLYYPKHLFKAGRTEKLCHLLTNLEYLEKRLAIKGIYALLEDYKLILSKLFSNTRQQASTFWDEALRQREIDAFYDNLDLNKKVRVIYDFIFRNAEFLQLFGHIPNFLNQQLFNQGISKILYDKETFIIPNGGLILCEAFRNKYDPFPAITKTLYEHKLGIADLSLCADGTKLLSASFDNTAKLWDLKTGECLRTIKFHLTPETTAMASDGSFMAIAGLFDNFAIHAYDQDMETLLYKLDGHLDRIRQIKLSNDNKFMVSCSSKGEIKLWDLDSKKTVYSKQYDDKILSCDISANGNTIALVTSENLIEIWNTEFDTLVFSRTFDKGELRIILLSNSCNELIIGGGRDRITEVWDIANDKLLYEIDGHGTITYDLLLDEKDKILISSGKDRFLKIWDFKSGKLLKSFEGHSRVTRRIAGTGDLSTLITGGGWNSNYQLRVWDIFRSEGIPEGKRSTLALSNIIPREENNKLLFINRKQIMEYDPENMQQKILRDKLAIQLAKVIDQSLYISLQDGFLCRHELNSGSWDELFSHSEIITAFYKGPDNIWLLGDWKGSLIIMDGDKKIFEQKIFKQKITLIEKINSSYVIYTFTDEFAYLDFERMEITHSYSHPERITSNISLINQELCFGDISGTIVLYNPENGKITAKTSAFQSEYTAITVNKQHHRIIAGSEEGKIRIWSMDLTQLFLEIDAHDSSVQFIELLENDSFISIPGNYYMDPRINNNYLSDNTLKKWDLFSGKCLAVYPLEEIITSFGQRKKGFNLGLRNGNILQFENN